MNDYGSYDVIVAGGGPAGLSASIAAARCGARTLLIERLGVLGSMATAGLCPNWLTFHDCQGNQVVWGIAHELIQRMEKMGSIIGHQRDIRGALYSRTLFDPELFKIAAFDLVESAGVVLFLHTFIVDVIKLNTSFRGLVIANKSGLGVVSGKVVVDATGDGDVAALLGGEVMSEPMDVRQPISLQFRVANVNIEVLRAYIKTHPEEFILSVEPSSLDNYPYINNVLTKYPPFLEAFEKGEFPPGISKDNFFFWTSGADINRGIVYVNATRITELDGLNFKDLSRAEIVLRKQAIAITDFLKRKVPGFNSCYLLDTASFLGVRESRRIRGMYVMTVEDVLNGGRFPDAIGLAASPVDIHGGKREEGKLRWLKSHTGGVPAYQIPYRILLPLGLQGILVAGRCVSATREALGALRLMPVCSITGQAAGTGAALASQRNLNLHELPIEDLQNTLRAFGQKIE